MGATIISTYELATWLGDQGAKISPQNHGGWCKYPFGAVKFTQAIHSSSMPDENGRPIYLGEPAGVVIQVDGKTVFHAGDTALFSDMKLIGDDAAIDLAFLPIGEHFVMGPKDAAKAVEFLHPKVVVPIHYGTFPPLVGDPKEFARLAEGKAKVAILQPGESVEV
jgi:L-ascorbate metabolism protein UlaG (beta-lactamase superfamily)